MNLLGKRYRCAQCGQTVLCLNAGEGEFECHGEPMEVVPPQKLPSGD